MINIYAEVGEKYYDFIKDFKAFPKRYDLGEAKPKILEQKVEVPYRDGVLFPIGWSGNNTAYSSRDVKINIKLAGKDPEYDYSRICSALNGRYGKLITSTLQKYFNEGLFRVGPLKTSKTAWETVLYMTAQPYKMRRTQTVVEHVFTANSTWTDFVTNEFKTVVPTLNLSANGTVSGTINGESVSVSGKGDHVLPVSLVSGKNDISLTSTAAMTASLIYREGRL